MKSEYRVGKQNQKVAIVTGGTSGIGKACAELLAQKDYSLFLVYRQNHERAELAQKELSEINPSIHVEICCADLSQRSSIQYIHQEFQRSFQSAHLEVLVSSHGQVHSGLFLQKSANSILKTVEEHLISNILLAHQFLQSMYLQKKGQMIFLGSMSAHRIKPGQVDYALSKGALEILVQSLSTECSHRGVTFNCLCPSLVQTDLLQTLSQSEISNRNILNVSAVVEKLRFLLSPEGQVLTGHSFLIE